MGTKEIIRDRLLQRYERRDMESTLDKEQFKTMYKEAVRDFYPQLREQYDGQSIYGISFEIANVVQRVFAEYFFTTVYLNTEEMYEEAIEDCEDEEEKIYYRFSSWAEWDVTGAETALFGKVRDYLEQNSLRAACDCREDGGQMPEEAAAWYGEHEEEFEEGFEEEREQIRLWLAEALGELRREGFWEEQGNAGIYVLPFEGECDIDKEEMIKTFREMDQNCHGMEYLEYLDAMEE